MQQPRVTLQIVWHNGIAVIDCRGRIVAGETEELRTAVLDAIQQTGQVILRLASVTRIDSAGLGLLAFLCASARRRRGDVKLVAPSTEVSQVLAITMLGRLFAIYPEVQAAVAAFVASEPAKRSSA